MENKDIFLSNKEKIKIVAIIILTFTLFIGIIFSNDKKVSRILEEKFFDFDFASISKIETDLEGKLEKTGKNWTLEFEGQILPLDQKRVETFIKDLEHLRKNKLISSDPEKSKDFGIKDTPSFKIFNDKNILLTEIYVGKAGIADSRLTYIKANNRDIYLTDNIFLSYKDNSYNTFVDTFLFNGKNFKLNDLNLKVQGKLDEKQENEIKNNYAIMLKDGFYYLNEQKIENENLLNAISSYRTEGLEIDKSKIKDYELGYRIEFKWNNNSINNLEVYLNKDKSKKDILLKKDLDEYYYTTNKWNFYDIFDLESKLKTQKIEEADTNDHDH